MESAPVNAAPISRNRVCNRCSCQALEKLLKGVLATETGKELKHGHDPTAIFDKIPKNERYGISQHYPALKRFGGHYQHRYHDNPDASQSASSAELAELDEIWLT